MSGRAPPYLELHEIVLTQLRMTADEYKRRVYASCRREGNSWVQFVSKRDVMLSYHMNSRDIKTMNDLRELTISDLLKHAFTDEVRTYVLQNKTGKWLKPKEVALLPERFEESKRGRRQETPKTCRFSRRGPNRGQVPLVRV